MEKIDYKNKIPNLIASKFNVSQMRMPMYDINNLNSEIPSVYFFLLKDSTEESEYTKIRFCINSFKGNLKWTLEKAVGSRKNYVIMPTRAYQAQKAYFDQNAYQSKSLFDILGEFNFTEICTLAIKDLPNLHNHMIDTL